MNPASPPPYKKPAAFLPLILWCGMAALLTAACSSGGGGDIQEATYVDGMETDSAVVQATPNGGYRTVSGDPMVVANGDIEPESMLPYGGGNEGIRQMEDEAPFQDVN